jgi:hypothetical protein
MHLNICNFLVLRHPQHSQHNSAGESARMSNYALIYLAILVNTLRIRGEHGSNSWRTARLGMGAGHLWPTAI